jgi:hypothetical protein
MAVNGALGMGGQVSDNAKKRAEAAKQYIENMLSDKSKHLHEKKQRCA